MKEIDLVFLLVLVLVHILLLIFTKNKNKYWIYCLISVLITILVLILTTYIEHIVHLNSPGLGEIGSGIITAGFRVVSIILSQIIIYRSIKKHLEKKNISKNSNYNLSRFFIVFCIIFVGFVIFVISQVGLENFGI